MSSTWRSSEITPELLASQVKSELDQINNKIDRICNYIDLTKTKDKKTSPAKETVSSICRSRKPRTELASANGDSAQPKTIGIDLRRKLSTATKRDASVSVHSQSKTSIKTKPKAQPRTIRQKLTLRSLATENPRNSSISSISCRTPNNRTRPLLAHAMKETQSMDSHAYFPHLKSVEDITYDSNQLSALHTNESAFRHSAKPARSSKRSRADESRERSKE